MAHRLTIARATFAAGLLRPDTSAGPLTHEEITQFHTILEATLTQCSPTNIQNCKAWLLKNVITSGARIGAFGKYAIALSRSFTPPEDGKAEAQGSKTAASSTRKRLHVLYLLNDLLHHTKFHQIAESRSSAHASLTNNLQTSIVELVSLAASASAGKNRRSHQRVNELLGIWADNGYFADDFTPKLKEAAENATKATDSKVQAGSANGVNSGDLEGRPTLNGSKSRDLPFVMPASHGDASTPYYDLPAANMIPHIKPNSTRPIRTQLMKPLQFVAGPADPSLVNHLKDFLRDVDRIYDSTLPEDEGIVADIDEMGQRVLVDKDTGDVMNSETYYGWSREFCERMKRRQREGPPEDRMDRHGRSLSRSRSRSRSDSPRKRRKYTSSRSQTPSHGRSSSRSRGRFQQHSNSRSRSRTAQRSARSFSRSRSPRRHRRSHSRSPDRTNNRVRQRTPPPAFAPTARPAPPAPPPPSQYPQFPTFNPNAPFQIPLGPNGMPLLPPRPPGYTGLWPPPPPPPPPPIPGNGNYNPTNTGFVPPPPPPQQNFGMGFQGPGGPLAGQWGNQMARGRGNGGWRGGGYQGRGRGRGRG